MYITTILSFDTVSNTTKRVIRNVIRVRPTGTRAYEIHFYTARLYVICNNIMCTTRSRPGGPCTYLRRRRLHAAIVYTCARARVCITGLAQNTIQHYVIVLRCTFCRAGITLQWRISFVRSARALSNRRPNACNTTSDRRGDAFKFWFLNFRRFSCFSYE